MAQLAARLSNSGNLSVNNLIVDGKGNSPQINVNNCVVHNLKEGQSLGSTTKMRWKNNEMLLAGQVVANNATLGNVNVNGNLSVNNCNIMPIGTITMFAGSGIPNGFLVCNGQSISKNDYQELYTIIGTTFGGDGNPNFNVPNTVNRFPLGKADSGVGQGLGDFSDTFNHHHSFSAHSHNANHNHSIPTHNHNAQHSHNMSHIHLVDHDHDISHTHTGDSHYHDISGASVGTNSKTLSTTGTGNYTLGAHSHSGSTNTMSFTSGSATLTSGGVNLPAGVSYESSSSDASLENWSGNLENIGENAANNDFNVSDKETSNTSENNPPYLALNFIIRVK